MVSGRWHLSIFIFLLFVLPKTVCANSASCLELFSSDEAVSRVSLPELELQTEPFALEGLYSEVSNGYKSNFTTVVVVGTTKRLNDKLLVFEKLGRHWASNYTPAPDNYQGDPRWPVMLLGPKLAYTLGFGSDLNDRMTAPVAATLNRKIEILNEILVSMGSEPIEIRFKEGSEKPETALNYLKDILEHTSLPLARSGHYAIHDISYHVLSILLSKKILDHVKDNIRLLFNFKSKLDADLRLTPFERKLLEKYFDARVQELTRYIDYATGNIGFIFTMDKVGGKTSYGIPFESYDTKSSVIDNLYLKTYNIFTKMPGKVESFLASEIGHDYKFDDVYFDASHSFEYRQEAVRTAGIKLDAFVTEFVVDSRAEIQALNRFHSTEELVNFVRSRLASLQQASELMDP